MKIATYNVNGVNGRLPVLLRCSYRFLKVNTLRPAGQGCFSTSRLVLKSSLDEPAGLVTEGNKIGVVGVPELELHGGC